MLGTGGISSHHPEVARVAGEVRSAANKLKVAKAAFLVAVGKHLKLGLEPKPRKQRVKVDKPATKKKAVTVTASKKPNMGPVARMQARKKRLAAAAKKK
jgi:hypothetical protein